MNTIKKIQVDGVDYDIQAKELTKVTYAELKEMRDNGSLAAGHLYRITDYEFTTVQEETKSAGHLFDIIVLATAENQLSELARAIQHEGDTYFDGNDLGAWELWYDLDNDTTKYEWADAENGKGVIYRMIDEKRNDCPYDFKNALFYNTSILWPVTIDDYYYTFSYIVLYIESSKLYDGTVAKQVKNCYNNSIGVYLRHDKKSLNLNVLKSCSFSSFCYYNKFGNDCYSNTLSYDCYDNNFGNSVSYLNGKYVKTSITPNDEYYDDGSGQLVPIKHPDLSTQPSILPYKFMGQYVYEQLIPVKVGGSAGVLIGTPLNVNKPIILRAELVGMDTYKALNVQIYDSSTNAFYTDAMYDDVKRSLYLRLVYTSMPEEGDYYGYNNY